MRQMIKGVELSPAEVNYDLAANPETTYVGVPTFEVPEHILIVNGTCPPDKTNDCVWKGCQGFCED
jgi:hypothetical protein